ncbi:glucosamine-6-phosphate deaminase [Sporosarcina obsidiansis]|uniref:glucosamine-6-phosphate deaminase n=1 Tax=Sporosarcina obsidiansis TaxID=2660748 RepID=UPI00129A53A2|nr:glucosamine-6-phosphate deaminase [Sporosarcina obsidiansis]
MNYHIYPTEEEVDQAAAELFISSIRNIKNPKVGLATGSTPIGLYQNLIAAYQKGEISFKGVTTYNLDEYIGLPESHPSSFAYFMNTKLLDHVDIPKDSTHIPQGDADDSYEEAERYERIVQSAAPLDIQLLGVGMNGHLGFNEPDDYLTSETHIVQLSETTRQANVKDFDSIDEVPKTAITMGMGTIMKAKKLLFFAKGIDKADIIQQVLEGPITTQVPASMLQLHANVHVFLDQSAASKLKDV